MSTNPDTQNDQGSVDANETKTDPPESATANQTPPEPQPVASESQTTKPEATNEATSDSTSEANKARKILIGSQRDAADPSMGSQAIRNASLKPTQVAAAIQVTSQLAASDVEASTPVAESVSAAAGADDDLAAALDDMEMDSLMGAAVKSATTEELELESRVKALVTRIHNDNVFFSLKGRFEGIASKRQFKTEPELGSMMDVVVTGFKEDEGLYEVNIPGSSVSVADWSDLTEGAVVEGKVTGSNTGGLEININNIRGFIPASQIDIVRVENFGDFINQKLQCVVTEVNEGRKKLVLSRRAILERAQNEKKQELMKTLEEGQTMDGLVTKLMDFGAFVDIGGVEGLVHVSKLSWERVAHPKEVLEPGQTISVKVEKINPETGKISLSYRDTLENPWAKIDEKYPEGSVVEGTVTRLAQFGAFVKLEPGVEGLVHISELAHHRVMAVKNVVKQGDSVSVKILSVDPQAQKIGLSLKATQAKPEKKENTKDEAEANEPIRESAVKKRDEPLKGGRDRSSGGEQFGLKW